MEKNTDGKITHYLGRDGGGEHTLCGCAFDGLYDEQPKLTPTNKKVNCVDCLRNVYDIQQLPKVKVRP